MAQLPNPSENSAPSQFQMPNLNSLLPPTARTEAVGVSTLDPAIIDSAGDMSAAHLERVEQSSGERIAVEARRRLGMEPQEPVWYDFSSSIATSLPPPVTAAPEEEKHGLGELAKDIGRGLTELPRAVGSGILKAINETAQTFQDVAGWIDQRIPGNLKGYWSFEEDGGIIYHPGETKPAEMYWETPTIESPTSHTGQLVEGLAQWLTGFFGTGKLRVFKQADEVGGAVRYAGVMARGAITDYTFMDDQQERLANLFIDTPLENDFIEWLAGDENDSALDNRFKNAVEGAGLGLLTDAVFQGMRGARSWANMRLAEKGARATPTSRGTGADILRTIDPSSRILGDPQRPLVSMMEDPDKLRAAAEDLLLVSKGESLGTGAPRVDINWNRIEKPEDFRDIVEFMTTAGKESTESARRGTQTFQQTILSAEQEDAFQLLWNRRSGETFNAEQTHAVRELWVSSMDSLNRLAQLAADNPSEINLFNFRKMAVIHHAIQKEVLGARAETARALSAWRIPVGTDSEITDFVVSNIEQWGGRDMAREMATKVAALSQSGMYTEASEFLTRGWGAITHDALQEAFIMGLLSNPKTHMVNITSNTAVMGLQLAERKVSGIIGQILRGDESATLGEHIALLQGMIGATKDAFRFAGQSFRMNRGGFGLGKIELGRPSSISAEAFGISRTSIPGRIVDVIGTGIGIPGRALGAEDEIFKTFAYRGELHAQAYRLAREEMLSGRITQEQISSRMSDLVDNPTALMQQRARDHAAYSTFTQPLEGTVSKALQRISNKNIIFKSQLPFIRTPANILGFAMERTPFAPLISSVRQDIMAGGARQELALARISIGTGAMLTAMDLAFTGTITGAGPAHPGERQVLQRAGWQPYSVRVGDRYFAYDRLDPIGLMIGISADVSDIIKRTGDDEVAATIGELLTASSAAIGSNLMNKTYFTGVANLFTALSDPQRFWDNYMEGLAGSLIPAGVGGVSRVFDPNLREVDSMLQAVRNRVPGLSRTLPLRMDLWGRPINNESGLGWAYDWLLPIQSSQYGEQPIDTELFRLGYFPSLPTNNISFSDGSVSATINLGKYPGALSRYTELAGGGLRLQQYSGKTCVQLLNDIVTGNDAMSGVYQIYSDGPNGTKVAFIRSIISDYREAARSQLMLEFPEIRTEVQVLLQQERQRRMEIGGQ